MNVAWQLRSVTEADGGFVAIDGSHKGAFPLPLPVGTSMEMESVRHIEMGAGDCLLFLGGALVHGELYHHACLELMSPPVAWGIFQRPKTSDHCRPLLSGAAAWRGADERRNVIHKYSPSHKALPRGHFLVPTFTPKL